MAKRGMTLRHSFWQLVGWALGLVGRAGRHGKTSTSCVTSVHAWLWLSQHLCHRRQAGWLAQSSRHDVKTCGGPHQQLTGLTQTSRAACTCTRLLQWAWRHCILSSLWETLGVRHHNAPHFLELTSHTFSLKWHFTTGGRFVTLVCLISPHFAACSLPAS